MSEKTSNQNILENEPELRAEFRRVRTGLIIFGAGIGFAIGSYSDDLFGLLGVSYLARPFNYLIITVGSLYIIWWAWRNRALKKRVRSSTRPHTDR